MAGRVSSHCLANVLKTVHYTLVSASFHLQMCLLRVSKEITNNASCVVILLRLSNVSVRVRLRATNNSQRSPNKHIHHIFIVLGELFVATELSNKLWPWLISEQALIFKNTSVMQMSSQCLLPGEYHKCTGILPCTICRQVCELTHFILLYFSREPDCSYEF